MRKKPEVLVVVEGQSFIEKAEDRIQELIKKYRGNPMALWREVYNLFDNLSNYGEIIILGEYLKTGDFLRREELSKGERRFFWEAFDRYNIEHTVRTVDLLINQHGDNHEVLVSATRNVMNGMISHLEDFLDDEGVPEQVRELMEGVSDESSEAYSEVLDTPGVRGFYGPVFMSKEQGNVVKELIEELFSSPEDFMKKCEDDKRKFLTEEGDKK